MKHILLIFIMSVTMIGCTSTLPTQKAMIITGYDFTKYTSKGFLITPEKYPGEYESIGVLNITLYPGVHETEKSKKDDIYEFSMATANSPQYYVDPLSTEEAIDSMYNIAKKMGANAIINFAANIQTLTTIEVSIPVITVSGFAIKRKDIKSVYR